MDKHNIFFTRTTYNLVRLDYLVFLSITTGLVIVHWREVSWWRFSWAFLWPDLVGTFPGLYWYYWRSSGDFRAIPRIFHVLYNVGHSFAVNGLVVAAWYIASGAWEWAMLALPIHLYGDRAIFGNIYKPFGLPFQPVPYPAFTRFLEEFERGPGRTAIALTRGNSRGEERLTPKTRV